VLSRILRAVATGGLILALGLALCEAGLRVAAHWAADRSSAWRPGATHRILSVGDSHTYGGGVEREESYPAQLQRVLDEREPGVHSVMNLGLPGMSSTQLRNRLPIWVQRYQPDLLVVWVGVNDAWNRAEIGEEEAGVLAGLDALLSRSRLYRLVRVRLHDRNLERYVPSGPEDRRWHVAQLEGALEDEVWTVRHAGVTERIAHGPHETPPAEPDERTQALEARLSSDLAAIAEYADASGIPMILMTYPIEASWYYVANRVKRRIAEAYDLVLVETVLPVQAIPEAERDWLWVAHPGPRIYAAIAAALAPIVAATPEGGNLRQRFPARTPVYRLESPHVYVPVLDASGRPIPAPDAVD
jgi:lysophospholipase L1-like esterase